MQHTPTNLSVGIIKNLYMLCADSRHFKSHIFIEAIVANADIIEMYSKKRN